MDQILLKASRRDEVGKKVKAIRVEGKLPAIIYGKGVEPVAIALDFREASKVLRDVSRASLLTIDVDGETFNALVRDRQREVISGNLLHVDFLAISLTEKVRTEVDIILEGVAPAVADFGAVLVTNIDRLEVECLPTDLPDAFRVDISGLESIGDGLYVKDVSIPNEIEVLSDLDEMVVFATAPQLEEVVEEAELEEELEEGVEPEVIEKGKQEDEEGSGE